MTDKLYFKYRGNGDVDASNFHELSCCMKVYIDDLKAKEFFSLLALNDYLNTYWGHQSCWISVTAFVSGKVYNNRDPEVRPLYDLLDRIDIKIL